MRILAIDYGTTRIGTAICDELEIVVTPFKVLSYNREVASEIVRIIEEEQVESVVIGMPHGLNGQETETTRRVRNFAAKLRALLPCPVEEWDETYSSRKAAMRMVEAGVKKKKREQKGTNDTWAAAIVLQEYLAARE